MPKSSFKISSIAAIVAAAILLVGNPVLALGVSPAVDALPTIMRGVSRSSSIRIMRGPGQEGDVVVAVSVDGGIAPYLKFEPMVLIPKDQNGIDFPFTVDPQDAPVGDYKGEMTFIYDPSITSLDQDPNNYGMSIKSGVMAIVSFSVSGDQVVAVDLQGSEVQDTESNLHPFVKYDLANAGNVNWVAGKADLTFVRTGDADRPVLVTVAGDKFPILAPGEKKSPSIELETTLPEGTYALTTTFYDRDLKSVGELVAPEFHVYPPGTLKQSGELSSLSSSKSTYGFGEKVSLDATFKNTGGVPSKGRLMTEVSFNGVYQDVLLGEEVVSDPGDEVSFTQIVEPKEAGTYTLRSYVKFAERKSNAKEVTITVAAPEGVAKAANSVAGIAVLSGVILLGVIVLVLVRRRKYRLAARGVVSSAPVQPVQPVAAPPQPSNSSSAPAAPQSSVDPNQRW